MTDTFARGWDYEPETKSGRAGFLSLPHKGSIAKIRIVAPPEHFKKETNFNNERKVVTRHLCLVIERLPSGDELKVFEMGDQIYIEMRKYLADPDWGDVTRYDFKITRNKEKTSDPGSEPFYSVQPNPNKSPITAEETKMVEESGINLADLARALSVDKNSKTSQTFAAPAKTEEEDNDLPF